jgi:hypothetical protein
VAPKPEPARLASVFGTLTSVFGIVLSVAAILAIMTVSNTVLALDIYSNLRDRDGHLCCGGQDCKPVQVTVLPNGSYYLPETDETIPADIAMPSPDNRFHHCAYYYPVANEFDRWGGPIWEDKPRTRCFFAPMNSS